MKKYIKIKKEDSNLNYLRIEVDYSKGSIGSIPGYRLSVVPVSREEKDGYTVETFGVYTGYKFLLFEAYRQSKKQQAKAEEMAVGYIPLVIDRLKEELHFEVIEL